MTRIDFYVLESPDEGRWIDTICKLIEKAHAQKKPVFIHTDDEQVAQRLDTALWGFRADSFIPHRTLTSKQDSPASGTTQSNREAQGSVPGGASIVQDPATPSVDIACGVLPVFQPILDPEPAQSKRGCGVLINLAREVPPFFSRFERTLEIVGKDEDTRTQSRQRYSYYRERGYPMNHHKLD